MRFSLGTGFLYINKHVCKKDWIMRASKPLVGVAGGGGGGGGGPHPFCSKVGLFNPPSPPPPTFCLILA